MNYPLDQLSWVMVLIGVVLLLACTYWVWQKTGLPEVIGLMALVISLPTSWVWFGELPLWTALFVVFTTAALFVIGMTRPEHKDDPWHFGALVVALFGKAVMIGAINLWPVLTGEVPVPLWLLLLLILLAIVSLLGWRSERARNMMRRLGGHLRPSPVATT